MPRSRAVAQLALDERVVVDLELEGALEERLSLREEAAEARRLASAADERADVLIERLELPEGAAIRVGRFRITRQHVKARVVSFEAAATSRVRISVIGEDE